MTSDRASRFIQLHNKISHYLRDITSGYRGMPFYELVDNAAEMNAAVRRHARPLKDYGALRNAIVHYKTYPPEVIAEPSEETLSRFERVVRAVVDPPALIPEFQRSVRCFSPGDKLTAALTEMRDNDFSQVVVRGKDGLSLLTVEGVARWFEQRADTGTISLHEATIAEALECDIPDSFVVMRRDQTVYDAQETFANAVNQRRPRLFAIIVSPRGSVTEKPLGIITPWDLLGRREH